MKNKKRTKSFFCGLCVALAVLTCFILCTGSSCIFDTGFSEGFELNWKVVLPENMKKLFRDSYSDFQNKGIRYAVFQLEEEPTEFIADFNRESDIAIESEIDELLYQVRFVVAEPFDIPEEYLPDWNEEYCWKLLKEDVPDNVSEIFINKCYMIYFTNLKRLSICEYLE